MVLKLIDVVDLVLRHLHSLASEVYQGIPTVYDAFDPVSDEEAIVTDLALPFKVEPILLSRGIYNLKFPLWQLQYVELLDLSLHLDDRVLPKESPGDRLLLPTLLLHNSQNLHKQIDHLFKMLMRRLP